MASRRIAFAIAMVSCVIAGIAAGQPDDGDDDDEDDTEDEPVVVPAPPVAILDPAVTKRLGFDHLVHGRNVAVAGGAAIACARCHPIDARGKLLRRPDHRSCFGECHGKPPVRVAGKVGAGDRARVCAACHAPSDLLRAARTAWPRLGVSYPPYAVDRDHGMAMSHAAHAGSACSACHGTNACDGEAGASVSCRSAVGPRSAGDRAKRGAVHARCAGCHAGTGTAKPAIAECASCHVPAYGSASGPTLIVPDLPVSTAFDHAGHARRAPKTECVRCHAAIPKTAVPELPTPKASDCGAAGCHDTKAAFGITEACTRCHQDRPGPGWSVHRPEPRFSHAAHVPRGATACVDCHQSDRRGQPIMKGHVACANAGCHAEQFGVRQPTMCQSCHVATEPWRKLVVDARPRDDTELGVRMPHARHPQPCATCHARTAGARELVPPRGHGACTTGAGCHARDAGPAPRIGACDGCHELGMVARRLATRSGARWSVRARFRHAPHATDPRSGAALGCAACHAGVDTSQSIDDLPTPKKPVCAPCHDGTTAFKITGVGCTRCHGK
jgi:c(7)-type cytochrome triheme protein